MFSLNCLVCLATISFLGFVESKQTCECKVRKTTDRRSNKYNLIKQTRGLAPPTSAFADRAGFMERQKLRLL